MRRSREHEPVSQNEAGLAYDKPDTEKSLLPADRIVIRQDNMAGADTGAISSS